MSNMRTLLHPIREELSLPNVLYALGDPHRLSIVKQLAAVNGEMSCGDITEVKVLAKSTGSHHFKVLREAGLVRMVQQGRRTLVSLRTEDLETRFPGLLDTVLGVYQEQ